MKTKKSKIIIGSRESKLAVLQSEMVRDYIKEKNPEMEDNMNRRTSGKAARQPGRGGGCRDLGSVEAAGAQPA